MSTLPSLRACLVPALLTILSAPLSPAQITLIGGTTRNGNFEETEVGGTDDGDRPFSETAVWINTNATPTSQLMRGHLRTMPNGLGTKL